MSHFQSHCLKQLKRQKWKNSHNSLFSLDLPQLLTLFLDLRFPKTLHLDLLVPKKHRLDHPKPNENDQINCGHDVSMKTIETGEEMGSLYTFQNKKVTTVLPKVGLSNGLAFDDKLKKFYYIDTFSGTLDQYDFDIAKGTISNGKPIYTLNPRRGLNEFKQGLDGMTIDIDGNLWVAVFNASKVIKIDPRKPETVALSIQLPAKQVI
ncbi:hypothetical protein NQ318_011751 [Aromia moschata]|uniref:SMP-30/Gluconolactonase/LRE-like region domain-containing protein n=1 Tax=Aromia moschata TaxID=1265417 RepID=A0AAV8Y1D5_9CUCU|nr:hypothetical protein NQ318_011751 [Aromia moschata]